MKKIVLLGDSIRLGYEAYVREALGGVAEFYSPKENCRFAQYFFRYAHEWKALGNWPSDVDIVHWNAGLWDALRLMGDDPLTPTDIYARFIARIDQRLRMLFPKAKMIFATSTSVNEAGFVGLNHERRNADIAERNAAAIEALSGTDTVIDDLYAVTKDIPDACRSDMTHFNTPEGVQTMGSAVIGCICDVLGISESDLASAKAETVNIPEKILGM